MGRGDGVELCAVDATRVPLRGSDVATALLFSVSVSKEKVLEVRWRLVKENADKKTLA